MASQAAAKFESLMSKAAVIRKTVNDPRLRPQTEEAKAALCHAYLANAVAAWNAYIVDVLREFFPAIADPANPHFHQVHTLLLAELELALSRFNTPNATNSRTMLLRFTGYDPINDWVWVARSMNGLNTRERLDEILKVRHSFAHGFSVPTYSWLSSVGGKVHFSAHAIDETTGFLRFLVKKTESGLKMHIATTYGKNVW